MKLLYQKVDLKEKKKKKTFTRGASNCETHCIPVAERCLWLLGVSQKPNSLLVKVRVLHCLLPVVNPVLPLLQGLLVV